MRHALVLVILAACGGGGDFSVSVLPPCPTCGPGHVRAAATTDESVGLIAQGNGVLAFNAQHLKWLGPDLSIVESASTDAPGDYLMGPNITQAVSAPDGHSFALVAGEDNDTGTTTYLFAFDAGGHTIWSQEIVNDYAPPPLLLAIGPDGDAVVAADTTDGFPASVGGVLYQGWISITKIDAATGALQLSRMFSSSGTTLASIAVAPDGGVVLAGELSGHIDLGGSIGDLPSMSAGKTVFMARLDDHYDGLWAKQYVATGDTPYADAVATDGAHVYMAGSYAKSVDLGDGVSMSTSDVYANYVLAYDDAGTYQWSSGTSADIGAATLAATPAGVMIGGGYLEALAIGGLSVPAASMGQAGVCAEMVDGSAVWVLATSGVGDDTCSAIGSSGGRAYLEVDAKDNTVGGAQTTIDSVTSAGQEKLLLEVGTTPAT